jgi:hypothetical protein
MNYLPPLLISRERNRLRGRVLLQLLVAGSALAVAAVAILANQPADSYQIYRGNTHSHTAYTWSHGAQYAKNGCAGIAVYANNIWTSGYVKTKKGGCPGIFVINGAQYPSSDVLLRPDWEKYQGPPESHFALAKSNHYDFYCTTDHSQEAALQPPSHSNVTWMQAKQQAAKATDSNFVAIAGFEYSENDGPGGQGHINVLNSDGMLNALAPGVDLPHFYKWLEKAAPNAEGPIVATFNHPGPEQYNDWDYRDAQVTDIITMLEVINSNKKLHYAAFVRALDKGWKVSPVCGNDNHGLGGIARDTSRTFILAKARTKAAILDAMKHRRTYASLDNNIQCRYTVNGAIMGSTLDRPQEFKFQIALDDPDTGNPKDKISKIDIVKDGGAVVQTYTPEPGHSIRWSPIIQDATSKYFFVRVWNAGGGDAPGADPANPVAWLAPVWTGR